MRKNYDSKFCWQMKATNIRCVPAATVRPPTTMTSSMTSMTRSASVESGWGIHNSIPFLIVRCVLGI